MNKILTCLIAGLIMLTACAQNNKKSNTQNNNDMKKTLIVYFSATGNTKAARATVGQRAQCRPL